jgi:DNA primase
MYQNRIIIPSYDDNGLLNYFVGRSFMGDNMKYKNPNVSRDIIPFDWFIAWSQPIILCEGVFDAISIRTNAIPMLSKKPSKSLLRKVFEKKVKTVYIALDDDAKKDAYRLSEFFKDFGIDSKVVNLPVDKDPNDLGWERITTLIDSTESASFSDSIQAKLYG